MAKEITLREHMVKAAAARWKGKSAKQRSDHGKLMREARRVKNSQKNIGEPAQTKILGKK